MRGSRAMFDQLEEISPLRPFHRRERNVHWSSSPACT